MIIIIDCFKQVKGAGKSIGIYNLALNLTKNLVKVQKTSQKREVKNSKLIVLGNQYNREDFQIEGVEFHELKYNPFNKLFCIYWELFLVKKYYRELKGDRIVFPRGYAPFGKKLNDIIIIHDMIPFYYHKHFPGYFNRLENFYIMNRLKGSARKCKKVITISNASKKEILEITNVSPEKISVIYNGCNGIAAKGLEEKPFADETPYIFAITSSLPHKNAAGIFKIYEKYCDICKEPLKLVVLGVEKPVGEISEKAAKQITCIKYVKENKKLYSMMKHAQLFFFMSLVEGFGFPPIEAMQLGVPVVCSNTSSLPEVVGEGAVLVNPYEELEAAEAMKALLEDEQKKNQLIEKGYENIKRFDWDKIAAKYWEEICNL